MSVPMRKRVRQISVVLVITGSVAAGLATASSDARSPASAASEGRTWRADDWVPFADAALVPTVDAARAALPFTARIPSVLGVPAAVYLHKSYEPQALGLVYETSLGHFTLIEELFEGSREAQIESFRGMAETCRDARLCDSFWTTKDLADGVPALFATGGRGSVTMLMWVVGEVRFQLMGPRDEFAPAQAFAIAKAIAAA